MPSCNCTDGPQIYYLERFLWKALKQVGQRNKIYKRHVATGDSSEADQGIEKKKHLRLVWIPEAIVNDANLTYMILEKIIMVLQFIAIHFNFASCNFVHAKISFIHKLDQIAVFIPFLKDFIYFFASWEKSGFEPIFVQKQSIMP